MRPFLFLLFFLFFLTFDSKLRSAEDSLSQGSSSKVDSIFYKPSDPQVVTPKELELRQGIIDQVEKLFRDREYVKIDDLARKLRVSKDSYPNGKWQLSTLYVALESTDDESSEAAWTENISRHKEYVKQRPDSITARVSLADVLVNYAWKARGNGYARTVTKDGWNLMKERLAESNKILIEAKELKEKCPEWYLVLQDVALGQGWERGKYDALVQEALQYEPSLATYHFAKTDYLLPRWHGVEGEYEEYSMQVADNVGGDEGDLLYARIVWYIEDMHFISNIFDETKLSWQRTKKGFEILLKKYPDSLWVASKYCYLAGLAHDGALQKFLYSNYIKDQVVLDVWESKERFVKLRDYTFSR
jgi:hypothetical protein